MRLRAKAICILIGAMSLLGLLSIMFFMLGIRPSFIEIEDNEAAKDLQRVVFSIQNEAEHLSALNNDWSAWDDTYDFILTRSDEYIDTNLPISAFTINSLNIIYYYNTSGELIWGEAHDLETEELINIKEFSGGRLPEDHILLKFAVNKGPLSEVEITGVWMTEHGPMLISSRPILTSSEEGPVRGALIMGRLLDNRVVEKLNHQVNVKFNILSIGSDSLPESIQNILRILSPEKPFYIDKTSADQMEMFTSFPDLNGASVLLIRAAKKREIFAESQTVMRYTIVSILLSIITLFVLLSVLLQKNVIGPIDSLTQHILAIGHSGDLSSQLKVQSKDEVGILAQEFNVMVTKLNEAKHKLQEQSFQLGMAELASGVMHNIRNTLHVLFGNIEKIRKTTEQIPVEKITKARYELGTITVSEERKADLIQFLDTTNTSLLDFISRTKAQLDGIRPLADETEHVLNSFEKWAYKERVGEKILLEKLIHESYQFLHMSYRDRISFIVEPGVRAVGDLTVNHIMLIQIFVNIYSNAIESINRTKGKRGEIHINADIEDMVSGPAVHIRICDNGAGIDRDLLHHIFERGFTTKSEDNKGMGLHWCANAVRSMNGELYAESNGTGQGACLHLILPKNT